MVTNMNQEHFAKFKELKFEALAAEQWVGNNVNNWWEWVKQNIEKNRMLIKSFQAEDCPIQN